jgi:hypothetical protein
MTLKYLMQIRNYEGELIKEFSSQEWLSLKYDRVLNDVSTFACVFPQKEVDWLTDNLLLPNALDYFIDIYRLNEVTGNREIEETYFLRLANPYEDETGRYFALGGLSLNHLLLRRIIDVEDDSRAAGGFVTDAGAASNVIKDLIIEHLGSNAATLRQIPNLSVTSDSSGLTAGGRWRYDSLFDVVQELATKGGIQFRAERVLANSIEFTVGTLVTDRTVTMNYPSGVYTLMKRERGNLLNPSLILDYQEQQNYIYALGSKDGDNQTVLKMSGTGVTYSPYNRIEFTQTVRKDDGSNSLYLLTGAVAGLAANLPSIELSFPVENIIGMQYKTDWDIGDYISVEWSNYEDDLQVKSIEVQVEEDQDTMAISVEKVAI